MCNFKILNSDDKIIDDIESLRQRLLRDPLGLVFSREQLQSERRTDLYIGAFDDNTLIGSLQLRRENGRQGFVYRVRQVVVETEYQGNGIGKSLMEFVHDYVCNVEEASDTVTLVLDARIHVVPFYLKLGYQIAGESFDLVGIEHHPMEKHFNKQ